VDADKVQQILHNVVSNAIKYTARGGVVRVWLEERPTAAPGLGARLARRFDLPLAAFTLVVEDNGLGMSERYLASLYQPFSREDRAESRQQPGAGLGLHITRGLVEALGGEIRLDSRPGEGTTVWIVLPRQPGGGDAVASGRRLEALAQAALAAGVEHAPVCLDIRRRLDRADAAEVTAAAQEVRRFLQRLGQDSRDTAAGQVLRQAGGECCWPLAPGLWLGLSLDPRRLAAAWEVATSAPESALILAGSRWQSLDETPTPTGVTDPTTGGA
jgi:hypothetical protein